MKLTSPILRGFCYSIYIISSDIDLALIHTHMKCVAELQNIQLKKKLSCRALKALRNNSLITIVSSPGNDASLVHLMDTPTIKLCVFTNPHRSYIISTHYYATTPLFADFIVCDFTSLLLSICSTYRLLPHRSVSSALWMVALFFVPSLLF